MPTKTISVRLTDENLAALRKLAEANNMTVHAVIHSLIAEGCEEHGIYWTPPPKGRPKKAKTE